MITRFFHVNILQIRVIHVSLDYSHVYLYVILKECTLPNYRFIFSIYFRNIIIRRNIKYIQTYIHIISTDFSILTETMGGYAFYHLIKSNIAQYKLDLLDNGLAVLSVHSEHDRKILQC